MSYKITLHRKADRDMDDIEEYLSQFSSYASNNFFDKLEAKLAALEDMPYLYPEYEEDPFFRKMVIDNYKLFYSVDEKRQLVVVHRIIHEKRTVTSKMLK